MDFGEKFEEPGGVGMWCARGKMMRGICLKGRRREAINCSIETRVKENQIGRPFLAFRRLKELEDGTDMAVPLASEEKQKEERFG